MKKEILNTLRTYFGLQISNTINRKYINPYNPGSAEDRQHSVEAHFIAFLRYPIWCRVSGLRRLAHAKDFIFLFFAFMRISIFTFDFWDSLPRTQFRSENTCTVFFFTARACLTSWALLGAVGVAWWCYINHWHQRHIDDNDDKGKSYKIDENNKTLQHILHHHLFWHKKHTTVTH